MILTVTPNPAYDVTYTVARVDPGTVHRVREVRERAGGKGINVARVLDRLGHPVCALGFGDPTFAAELDAIGIPHDLEPALPRVRRTVVVHGDDDTTSFWEPGATLSATDSADRLCDRLRSRVAGSDGVVVSGSLPPGAGSDLPARLARIAVDAGVPVIVDTDGDPLRIAARVPDVVLVPNADELDLLAEDAVTDAACLAACTRLLEHGPRAVLATRGAVGIVAATRDGAWTARADQPVDGNPTGAGDATAAAVIAHLTRQPVDWPALLADAVATSAAAVAAPVAGAIDASVRDRVRPHVDRTTASGEEDS